MNTQRLGRQMEATGVGMLGVGGCVLIPCVVVGVAGWVAGIAAAVVFLGFALNLVGQSLTVWPTPGAEEAWEERLQLRWPAAAEVLARDDQPVDVERPREWVPVPAPASVAASLWDLPSFQPGPPVDNQQN